jgi:prepilin-type N-terminal cleavage/methylation domain-containing protein
MICQFGEKLKRNKKRVTLIDKRGFTLLEMLTSVFIIVMMTAFFIANYRSNNKRSDLTMTAQKLVADIHAAQNNTLGLNKYGTVVPPGGWGVHFDLSGNPGQYILFADMNYPASSEPGQERSADSGFMRYDNGEGDSGSGARVVTLPAGVFIDTITTGNGTTTAGNVTFLPPDPKTNIFDEVTTATSTWMTISLRDKRENMIKTIKVNFLGLAEVIN